MNEQRLRRIARKVNADAAAKELEEKEEKERKEKEEHEATVARQIKEWPPYIEKEIEQAAGRGEFKYEYDVGDADERVIKHLFIEFASLNPAKERRKKTRIVNYDMGTDEEYYTWTIVFRW